MLTVRAKKKNQKSRIEFVVGMEVVIKILICWSGMALLRRKKEENEAGIFHTTGIARTIAPK